MARSKKEQKSSVRTGEAKAGKRKVYRRSGPQSQLFDARKDRHALLMVSQDKARAHNA